MSITLEQVNDVLALRGKLAVTAEQLNEAFDYAMGVYGVPSATLYHDSPRPTALVLGIAILAEHAPFVQVATAAVTQSEVSAASGASVKKTYADAPRDAYPLAGGLLAPFAAKQATGISFGVSSR